jgi:hypothetical protein
MIRSLKHTPEPAMITTLWTQAHLVEAVMNRTGCDASIAREYLLAEEGDAQEAIRSLWGDMLTTTTGSVVRFHRDGAVTVRPRP